jgi:hypothetical protein
MDAIGTDEHVAASRGSMRTVAVKKVDRDTAVILGERRQTATEMNA